MSAGEKTEAKTVNTGPLTGIRVLEVGSMVAGPVAATLLADLGAEVIKIETPEGGDSIRKIGPFVNGESLYWNVENRNKRSVTLDLHHTEGQETFRDLVKRADLVVENLRPGTMDKWNIGYKRLCEVNPRIVLLSISGFGQTGPMASRTAYDRAILAFSGYLNMTGFPDRPPVRPATAIADYQSALFGAFSAISALYNRDALGGKGQHIDVAMYETIFRFTDVMLIAHDKIGLKRERTGNIHFAAAPGDHYETSTGRYIAMTVANNAMFTRTCCAIGKPELDKDPRFHTHDLRVKNVLDINRIVAEYILKTPEEEVLKSFDREGVAYSVIYNVDDILGDEHYKFRGSIASIDHPRMGPIKMAGAFPRMSETPPAPLRVAPELGADTDDVLRELLGMSPDQIAQMRKNGTC